MINLTAKFLRKPNHRIWQTLNHEQRQQLRLALGVTVAMGIAVTAAWPLAFISIIFTCSIMTSGKPCMSFQQGLGLLAVILIGVVFGLLVSSLFADNPVLCIAVVAVCLLNIFYLSRSGMNALLTTFLLISITLLPLMAQQSFGLALLVSVGLLFGASVALSINWLLYAIIPDPSSQVRLSAAMPSDREPGSTKMRVRQARNSLIAVLPVVVAIYSLELTNSALIMIFAVILAQNPDLQAGYKGCVALLLGNSLGGFAAIAIYAVLVLVPSLGFLLLITFVFSAFLAQRIFSSHKLAPIASMALSTICLLIGSVLLSDGTTAGEKFAVRIFQLFLVTLYVIASFSLLTLDWKKQLGRFRIWG